MAEPGDRERMRVTDAGVAAIAASLARNRATRDAHELLLLVAPVRRYEHDKPGKLLHLDLKKLGCFERPGHRITGGSRQLAGAAHGIDDHSRKASARCGAAIASQASAEVPY